MAEGNIESRDTTTSSPSDDFSVISGYTDSILRNSSWPRQDDNPSSAEYPRTAQTEGTFDRSQISASHYALATAYERVTKKLSQAEQRNQQLRMQGSYRSQDSFGSARLSGAAGSHTNYAMHADLDASVNDAWEAYNEKCKECQQLREDLEDVKQKLNNTEHLSRIQNLQENVLREKAKQDDVVRRLERTKMEAGNLEKKEIMAREELEKEKEYQKSIIDGAERRHRELEQRIEELQNKLTSEKRLTEDMRKRQKDHQKVLQNEFNSKSEILNSKIRELEEQNIALKEEVAFHVSMQASLPNGLSPSNLFSANGPLDSVQASAQSVILKDDKDAAALGMDIQLLRDELEELRAKAVEQANVLQALYQSPKLNQLMRSTNQIHLTRTEDSGLPPSLMRSGFGSIPAQRSTELLYMRKETATSPGSKSLVNDMYKDDYNQSWPSSSSNPQDLCSPGASNVEVLPGSIERSDSQNTKVLKATEEFIQSLDQEGTLQSPGSAGAPTKADFNTMFPPMDVSRTIHKPESGGPTTVSAVRTTVTSSATTVPNSQPLALGEDVSNAGSLPMQRADEDSRGLMNGQRLPQNMQNSLVPFDDDYKTQYFSAVPSHSLSSSDTLVLSPTGSQSSNGQTSNQLRRGSAHDLDMPTSGKVVRIEGASEALASLNKNHKQSPLTRNSLSDLSIEIPHSSRQSQLSANFDAPRSRYLSSVEDDDSFEPITAGLRQPKEFVVPKVVRASDLPAQARKAFQDSGHKARAAQTPPRPAIRAKSKTSSSNQEAGPGPDRPENGDVAHPSHRSNDRDAKRNEYDVAVVCPVCDFSYPLCWTEENKRIHVNGHFSDDDDGVLALD